MSGGDPRTETFHLTQVTTGDTTCSVNGVFYCDRTAIQVIIRITIYQPIPGSKLELPVQHNVSMHILTVIWHNGVIHTS